MSLQQIDRAPIFKTTILIGKYAPGASRLANCPVELTVEISNQNGKGDELSIQANVWMVSRRDIYAGGQLRENVRDYLTKPLIGEEKLARILEIWDRWHLNGLQAGCEHQRARGWGKTELTLPSSEKKLSGWVYPTEHPEGVLCKPCPVCGYKYGSAWLREELPQEIIDEIKSWGENQAA